MRYEIRIYLKKNEIYFTIYWNFIQTNFKNDFKLSDLMGNDMGKEENRFSSNSCNFLLRS